MIPEGVTEICDAKKDIFSREYGTFEHCASLVSVHLPEMLERIRDYAFCGCSALTEIVIPEGVTSIGQEAFKDTPWLEQAKIDGMTVINYILLDTKETPETLKIPKSVTRIGDYALNGNTALTAIQIPEGVTSIGEGAFRRCESLTEITIPEGVTTIGTKAFQGSSIVAVTVPDGVAKIGYRAFADCPRLQKVVLPDSVTEIGSRAFTNCPELKFLHIPDGVKTIWDISRHDLGKPFLDL